MIEDGLSYPLEGDDAVKNLLIGSGLLFLSNILNILGFLLLAFVIGIVFFPIALVIGLPVAGYIVAVLRETVAGEPEPPAFDDWGQLFVDGLKAAAITTVYSFVPMLVFFGLGFLLFGAGAAAGDTGGGILSGLGLIVFLLAIPVYLIVAYVTPAALTNFAVEDSLGAAFDVEAIVDVITDGDYLVAAVVAVVVSGVAGFVATVLNFILIGILVSPVIYFYVYVAAARIFGSAYLEATRAEGEPDAAAAAR